jgi:hypothetical protein
MWNRCGLNEPTRRVFFRRVVFSAGGCALLPARVMEAARPARADHCIFIRMVGAPSHVDTFDLKEGPWLPRSFQPARYGDLLFPRGLFPDLAERLGSIALVRSARARTLVHELAQTRLPAAELVAGAAGQAAADAELRGFDNLGPAAQGVERATSEDRSRYGDTRLGSACAAARHLLRSADSRQLIQIDSTGWDNHADIYAGALNATDPDSLARQFDRAVARLIGDLALDGRLGRTLVVAMGEFGRSVGPLNDAAGRDHDPQQAVMVAGAGIRGPKAIGATDRRGGATTEYGWKHARDIRAEDIRATVYSALGVEVPSALRNEECDSVEELWN